MGATDNQWWELAELDRKGVCTLSTVSFQSYMLSVFIYFSDALGFFFLITLRSFYQHSLKSNLIFTVGRADIKPDLTLKLYCLLDSLHLHIMQCITYHIESMYM